MAKMTKKQRSQAKGLLFVAAILVLIVLRVIVAIVDWQTGKGSWFSYLAGPIGFLFCFGVVYFFLKHLIITQTYIKTGVVIAVCFYCLIGISKFFLPYSFIKPVSIASGKGQLFDTKTGKSVKAVCPMCGREFSLGTKFCSEDGTELVQGEGGREELEKKGLNLQPSPFQQMMHEPGEETTFVAPNYAGITLPMKLKAGQKMKISASGKVRDLMADLNSGPRGIDPPLWLRDGRQYRCGGSWLALCVKVNPGPWQYCGNGCEVANAGNEDANILMTVNEATADRENHFHPEWWEDNSGGFAIEYVVY